MSLIKKLTLLLYRFAQVSETKLHEVDERLDEIEQILALYEQKLELDPEVFENVPDAPPEIFGQNQPEVLARTDNPLQNANKPVVSADQGKKGQSKGVEVRGKTVKKVANTKATEKAKPAKPTYVPPPPPEGAKIPPPVGMPTIKVFPISSGPPPALMKFPNIESAPPEAAGGGGGDGDGGEVGQDDAAPADDGFTPDQRRKLQLEEDPDFKMYKSMYRMRIPLIRIIDKIKMDGKFTEEDIKLFATDAEIAEADAQLKL